MQNSHDFAEPLDQGSEHPWTLVFPGLPDDKSHWLFGSLVPELRIGLTDPTREQEAAIEFLRAVATRYVDLELEYYKFSMLFLESRASGLIDLKVRLNFDWGRFFASDVNIDLFISDSTAPLLFLSIPAAREAWLGLPLERRANAYMNYFPIFIGLIESIEGIALPTETTKNLWLALSKYPDRIGALRRLPEDAENPLDLSRLTSEEERRSVRELYLRLATENATELFATLYDPVPFQSAVDEIFRFVADSQGEDPELPWMDTRHIDESPGFRKKEPGTAVRTCWDYLLNRLSRAEPEETFIFLKRVLPISDEPTIEYFGDRDASRIRESSAVVVAALLRENVIPLIERSIGSTKGRPNHHDPFSHAIIADIDGRLAKDPQPRLAFAYALLVRWFDAVSSESIPLLGGMKSLGPMVLESIKETGGISPLLCLGEYCDIDAFQEAAWRDAIAMILGWLGYKASSEAVTADERNTLFQRALFSQSYSGLMPALFSNPCLEYARIMFDQGFVASLQSDTVSRLSEAQRLLSVAIALGERATRDYMGSRLRENRPAFFLPSVAFALSRFDCNSAMELASPDRIEELGLFKVLTLEVLRFLVRDESLLLEAIVARYFAGGMNEAHPRVSDFISSYSSLLFEKSDSLDRTLKPTARRVVETEALGRLARFIVDGVGADAHIGLALADLILHDDGVGQTPDAEFSEACKKAAQRWFDATRASARSGARWRDLPSPEPCLQAAGSILRKLKGPWPAVKQLLTLFRHVPVASIGSDLDPRGEKLVDSWRPVAAAIHDMLDRAWDTEKGRALRAELTHDLLDKLKPSKDPAKKALVEPDEIWRYAYVRAVADLGADPSDTGHFHHQVLDKCAVNDPSPRVRKAAAEASASLKTRRGWKAGSSRRMLLHAWWWIRQAHLISSGAEIDREAALRRRETETRI